MILPRGITGFFEGNRDEGIPEVDPRGFVRACEAAARAESGRIEGFEPVGVAGNHHRAIVRLGDRVVAVLCNAHFPWIAFAEASGDRPIRFQEVPTLACRIEDAMRCEVIRRRWLETPPEPRHLAKLGAAEHQQIRYWRPRRLGDILFHSWD